MFDRMKEALGCETDAGLAWWPGTSPQSLSNRRPANSVPYREATFIACRSRLSLKYLLTADSEAQSWTLVDRAAPVYQSYRPGLTNPLSTVGRLTNKGAYILRKSNRLTPIQK